MEEVPQHRRRYTPTGAPAGRPRKLTREAIVQAALAIIDRQGDQALTMRSLAAKLRVQPTTIYTYFNHLDEVEEAVIESLVAEIPALGADSDVPLLDRLIEYFTAVRKIIMVHPQAWPAPLGSVAWRWNIAQAESFLALMVPKGMDAFSALAAYAALFGVVISNAGTMQVLGDMETQAPKEWRRVFDAMKGTELPYLKELMGVAQHPAENFRRALEVLIARLLPAEALRPKAP